jgi:hypothetical protein
VTPPHPSKRPIEHLFAGILALALVAVHFAWFYELYLELFTEGLGPNSFGAGQVLAANILLLAGVLAGLACLVWAAVRSWRARHGTTFLPSVALLGLGCALPWIAITVSWLIAGDAM